jgi:hypothetical protein
MCAKSITTTNRSKILVRNDILLKKIGQKFKQKLSVGKGGDGTRENGERVP